LKLKKIPGWRDNFAANYYEYVQFYHCKAMLVYGQRPDHLIGLSAQVLNENFSFQKLVGCFANCYKFK